MNQLIKNFLTSLVLAAAAISGAAEAQKNATREEAKAFVDAAIEHVKKVGQEQAAKDFTTNKASWVRQDMYIFMYDSKGIALAHGANDKIVGRNMFEARDGNGVAMIQEMTKLVAKADSGWVDYDWPHPESKKLEPKSSYVRRLPSGNGFLGTGIYRR